MTDRIARELKQAVVELQDVQQPDLEQLVERATRRQQRRRLTAVLVVCAGVSMVGAIVWGTVRLSDQAPTQPAAKSEVGTFKIPTDSWRPGKAGYDAHAVGILKFTPEGCPFLESGSRRIGWVAFPANAIGVETTDGTRYVTDGDVFVYGQEGEILDARGGSVHRDTVKDTCGDNETSIYGFGVMQEPSDKRLDLSR